jgi:PLP dependent protein
MSLFADLHQRYSEILSQIQKASSSKKTARQITLIAVSKMQPVEAIETLYRLGHRDFGENYVQELVSKARELDLRGCTGIRWHFIGHLQTNKVKLLIPFVYAVHSVDSERLGLELAKRWKIFGRGGRLPIFIEVNIDDEERKSGVLVAEAPRLAELLASVTELDLMGLMCIPALNSKNSAESFHRLRELEARCRPYTSSQLSMGMTDDFEVAIGEGATHVRIGTALFGARHAH